MDKQIDIYIFGMDDKLFQELFPEKQNPIEVENIGKIEFRKKILNIEKTVEDFNLFIPFFIESLRSKCYIILNAFNYPKLSDNNYKRILKFFHKSINKEEENRNNIVIKFSDSCLKDFSSIINKIKVNKPFLLYVLTKDEIKENEFEFFKFPQYISYTKDYINCNNEEKLFNFGHTIVSFIMKKITYFFELDSTFKYSQCFIECNILLIGESRAGKSSFINRVFNKLISHEDANLESVTYNSSQYTFKKGNVGIKFIDTPGIIKEENNKFIEQILDEYFGKIHLIFFFIKAQSNLENCIEILKYIKLKNEKNVKEGNKTIPLLFIKNGEDLEINSGAPPFSKYLINELKKKVLYELYDDKFKKIAKNEENKTNESDDEDLFNENEETENNYDNYCDRNIIQIHIPTGKNINKVFLISKEYLIKNNKFLMNEKDNEFIQMKENTKNLIKFYIKEEIEKNKLNKEEKEEKQTLLKRCNDFIDRKKKECSFLINNLKLLNIKKGNIFTFGIGILAKIILVPIIVVSSYLPTIVNYSIFRFAYSFFDEYILPLSIQYGFDDKDLIEYDLKKYLIKIGEQGKKIIKDDKKSENMDENIKEKKNQENNEINGKEKIIDKKNDNNNAKEIQKLMEPCKEFFNNLLLYIGPIQLLIKSKELSKDLFDLFEELKNRKEKEWITYRIHEFEKE